ncbi:unnamed protein product [Musa textilis]
MFRDVERLVKQCRVYHLAKTRSQNSDLYTLLPVPNALWEEVSPVFILGRLRTQRNKDFIIVVVNRFSKISHFVLYNKSNDASYFVDLYFKEMHGIPRTMMFDRDSKFLSHFWKTLWRKLGTYLNFNSSHHPQTDRQTEVTNKSLGNLPRSYVGKNIKQ